MLAFFVSSTIIFLLVALQLATRLRKITELAHEAELKLRMANCHTMPIIEMFFPVSDEIINSASLNNFEWINRYFECLGGNILKRFPQSVGAFCFSCEKEKIFEIFGSNDTLLSTVLNSLIDPFDMRMLQSNFSFSRFNIGETIVFPLETSQCKRGILWLGFHNGFQIWPIEAEEVRLLIERISQEILRVEGIIENRVRSNQQDNSTRERHEFLTQVSHDIRSPLNNIKSVLNLFKLEGLREDGTELLDVALKNAEAMNEIVETILDYSSEQSGKLKPYREKHSLRDVIEEVRKTYELAAKVKKLSIIFDCSIDPKIDADIRHIRRIASNLISNAIKYTSAGKITLSLEVDETQTVLFEVKDTGIGLTTDQLQKLFTPFSRFHRGIAEGAGLGLCVTKNLVESNLGTISVRSEYGIGTIFSVGFAEARNDESNIHHIRTINHHTSLDGVSILIVDDDFDWLSSLSQSLERVGASVYVAQSSNEAKGILNVATIDVVITDNHMPGGNGMRLIESVRALPQEIPIILLSGMEYPKPLVFPKNISFMTKPIDSNAIVSWIQDNCRNHLEREIA